MANQNHRYIAVISLKKDILWEVRQRHKLTLCLVCGKVLSHRASSVIEDIRSCPTCSLTWKLTCYNLRGKGPKTINHRLLLFCFHQNERRAYAFRKPKRFLCIEVARGYGSIGAPCSGISEGGVKRRG